MLLLTSINSLNDSVSCILLLNKEFHRFYVLDLQVYLGKWDTKISLCAP